MRRSIAINGRFTSQNITGVQRYAHELVSAIDEILPEFQEQGGVDITLLTPPRVKNLPVLKNIKIQSVGRLSGHLWEQFEFPLFLRKYDRTVHLCNAAPIYSLFFHNRIFTTIHDLSFLYFPQAYSWSYKLVYRFLSPLILKFSTGVVTVSEFEKEKILSYFPGAHSRLVAIHSGAIPKSFELAQVNAKSVERQKYSILFVGSASRRKNLDGLINACISVRKKIPQLRLKIVAPANTSFQKFTLDTHSDWIEWLQINNDRDLIDLYRSSSALVVPSHYESFGFPGLEAMAMGCPVVAANNSALPEIYRDAALYFDPNSETEIADKIIAVLSNSELAEHFQIQGYKTVNSYSWRKCAKAYLNWVLKISNVIKR